MTLDNQLSSHRKVNTLLVFHFMYPKGVGRRADKDLPIIGLSEPYDLFSHTKTLFYHTKTLQCFMLLNQDSGISLSACRTTAGSASPGASPDSAMTTPALPRFAD